MAEISLQATLHAKSDVNPVRENFRHGQNTKVYLDEGGRLYTFYRMTTGVLRLRPDTRHPILKTIAENESLVEDFGSRGVSLQKESQFIEDDRVVSGILVAPSLFYVARRDFSIVEVWYNENFETAWEIQQKLPAQQAPAESEDEVVVE